MYALTVLRLIDPPCRTPVHKDTAKKEKEAAKAPTSLLHQ